MKSSDAPIRYETAHVSTRLLAVLVIPVSALMVFRFWSSLSSITIINLLPDGNGRANVVALIIIVFVGLIFSYLIFSMIRSLMRPDFVELYSSGLTTSVKGNISHYEWNNLTEPTLIGHRSVGYGDSTCIKMRDKSSGDQIVIPLSSYRNSVDMVGDIQDAYAGKPFKSFRLGNQQDSDEKISHQNLKGVYYGVGVVFLFALVKIVLKYIS